MSGAGPPVLVTGTGRLDGDEGETSARSRRMDAFARAGVAAAGRALLEAGYSRGQAPDPRTGVVVATSLGCRASIAEHQLALSRAASLLDLSPSVFARTVHSTVAGELAIEWGLGGAAETVTSGAASGVDALLLARDLIASGAADRLVVAGAEGLSEVVARGERLGSGASVLPLAGVGAALVLERAAPLARATPAPCLLGGVSLFSPEPVEALERLAAALGELDGDPGSLGLVLASPEDDGALAPEALARGGLQGPLLARPSADLLGSSALAGAVAAVEALRTGRASRVAVVVRDPRGPSGVLLFGAPVSGPGVPR